MSEGDIEEESNFITLILFTMIFTILIIFAAYSYQNLACMGNISKFVPNASGNIVLGMALGGLLSLHQGMDEQFSFNEEFFFLVMLPPIIFASGFNLRKDYFFYNLGTILVFAFVGTAIATAVIAGLLYWLSEHVYELKMNECLIFASLISAIDPVATIVTMQAAGVGGRLYALIFGEAVLNDAVAIVINGVFLEVAEENKDIFAELAISIPKILGITVASVLIGVITALGSALLYKKSQLRENHVLEVALFFILGMIPYMMCASAHGNLSGIMAILFSGIFFDYYTYYHLSKEGKTAVKVIVHMLEFVFEGFIFFFLGTSIWSTNNKWEFGLFFLTLAACLIGRAVAVFPLTLLVNLLRKHKITFRESIMIWYSGLRGPVAFALAFRISSKAVAKDDREVIITTTLLIIWVTSFLMGGTSDYLLQLLGLTGSHGLGKNFMESRHWFRKLDRNYLKSFGVNTREFKARHDITNYAITRPSRASERRSENPELPTHFIQLDSPEHSLDTNNLNVPVKSPERQRGGEEGGNESISVVEMNEVTEVKLGHSAGPSGIPKETSV